MRTKKKDVNSTENHPIIANRPPHEIGIKYLPYCRTCFSLCHVIHTPLLTQYLLKYAENPKKKLKN